MLFLKKFSKIFQLQDHVVVPASCNGVSNNNNNVIVVDSKDNDYDNTSALFAKLMVNEKVRN